MDRLIFAPLGFLFLGAIAIAIMAVTGPIGWIGIPAAIYLVHLKDKRDLDKSINDAITKKFPHQTLEEIKNGNIKNYPASLSKNQNAKDVRLRQKQFVGAHNERMGRSEEKRKIRKAEEEAELEKQTEQKRLRDERNSQERKALNKRLKDHLQNGKSEEKL